MNPLLELINVFPGDKFPREYNYLFDGPNDLKQHQFQNRFLAVLRILRFLRPEQNWLTVVPNPDGSNLDLAEYQLTFEWFRSWLSLLHRGTLLPLNSRRDGDTLDLRGKLDSIAKFAQRLCDNETERFPDDMDILSITDHNAIFVDLFYSLIEDLRRQVWPTPRDSLYSSQNEFWPVLLQLCEAEFDFEKKMQRTHVEDSIISKRIRLSEFPRKKDTLDVIQSINEAERRSFWIRQLRQHGFKRPWKQLHFTRDESSMGQSLLINLSAESWFENENIAKVLDVRLKRMHNFRGTVECAGACLEDFESGELLMELHCGHWGHTECLFGFWNADDKFSFPCPFCRHDPGPLLKKMELDLDPSNINREYQKTEAQLDEDAYNDFMQLLSDELRFLNSQYVFPDELRRRALRHQARLDEDEARTQQRRASAAAAGALWATDPSTTEGVRLRLYPPEEDDQSHEMDPGFWFEDAYYWHMDHVVEWYTSTRNRSWESPAGPSGTAILPGMPDHLWRVWSDYRRSVNVSVDIFVFLHYYLMEKYNGRLVNIDPEDIPYGLRRFWDRWVDPLVEMCMIYNRDIWVPGSRAEFEEYHGIRWAPEQFNEAASESESSAAETEPGTAYDPNHPDLDISEDSDTQLMPIDFSDEEMTDVGADEESEGAGPNEGEPEGPSSEDVFEDAMEHQQANDDDDPQAGPAGPFFNAFLKAASLRPVNPIYLEKLKGVVAAEGHSGNGRHDDAAAYADVAAKIAAEAKTLLSATFAQRYATARRQQRRSRRTGDGHVHFASPLVDADGRRGRIGSTFSTRGSVVKSPRRKFGGNLWDRTGYLKRGWTVAGKLPEN